MHISRFFTKLLNGLCLFLSIRSLLCRLHPFGMCLGRDGDYTSY
jgi:hypothetical protein